MKTVLLMLVMLMVSAMSFAEIKVSAVKGDVLVRRGTSEQWTPVATGDVLKPEDSMRLGKHATATIITDDERKLVVPELVQLDLADVRSLTQEELLLQLAMERVRSVPDRDRSNDLAIPHTTTVHGANMGAAPAAAAGAPHEEGMLELNGVKVLYHNGFYATSALRAKELFRLMPDLAKDFDTRFMIASALEKMDVDAEALDEYVDISKADLTSAQRAQVNQHISLLKKKTR